MKDALQLLRELTNTEPGCYEAPHLNEKSADSQSFLKHVFEYEVSDHA